MRQCSNDRRRTLPRLLWCFQTTGLWHMRLGVSFLSNGSRRPSHIPMGPFHSILLYTAPFTSQTLTRQGTSGSTFSHFLGRARLQLGSGSIVRHVRWSSPTSDRRNISQILMDPCFSTFSARTLPFGLSQSSSSSASL